MVPICWIAPDGKSQKKPGTKIMVRVIEYTIDIERRHNLPTDYQFDWISGFGFIIMAEYH